jgi:integrase
MRLPRGVYVKSGRYYRVHSNRWHALTRVAEGEAALLTALAMLRPGTTPKTISDLLAAFLAAGMTELAPATRRQYARAAGAALLPAFGHMRIVALTTAKVARYLEQRKIDGRGPSGNRERAVLSAAYEFGLRRGYCESNPCRGVRRNREVPRRHYVRDATLRQAIDSAPAQFAELLSAAYLTGMRQGDLVALRRDQLTPAGIEFTEAKTGRQRLIEWSPTLRRIVQGAIERADELADRRKHPVPAVVFTNRFGRPWGVWAIQSERRRQNHDFHFHDLRGKAASDTAHNVLGRHSSLPTYLKRERSKPVR